MGWKTIKVENEENIRLYLDNLMIIKNNNRVLIPLTDIDTLIIENYTATFSNRLLEKMIERNINIILCNFKHEPYLYLVPIVGNHMSYKVFNDQLKWNPTYKSNLWETIVKNKIHNQKATLKKLNIDFDAQIFDDFMNDIKPHDISNREGHAAKAYWKYLFGSNFVRDYKLNVSPLINSALNYGYAVLRGMIIRTIIKKGLDPRISIFHKNYFNYFALASDLMEPFRQLVDYVVFSFDHEVFSRDNKDKLISFLANAKVYYQNKEYYLNHAIDLYVDNLKEGKLLNWVDLWK